MPEHFYCPHIEFAINYTRQLYYVISAFSTLSSERTKLFTVFLSPKECNDSGSLSKSNSAMFFSIKFASKSAKPLLSSLFLFAILINFSFPVAPLCVCLDNIRRNPFKNCLCCRVIALQLDQWEIYQSEHKDVFQPFPADTTSPPDSLSWTYYNSRPCPDHTSALPAQYKKYAHTSQFSVVSFLSDNLTPFSTCIETLSRINIRRRVCAKYIIYPPLNACKSILSP